MTIRKATQNDLTDIVAIYNETIPGRMVTADTEEVSVADKQAWFESHTEKRPIFVFEQQGKVLAWLSYKSFYGRPAYDGTVEISIYITQQAQGQGLGKQLLTFSEQHAKSIQKCRPHHVFTQICSKSIGLAEKMTSKCSQTEVFSYFLS